MLKLLKMADILEDEDVAVQNHLPPCALEKICSMASFGELKRFRLVCRNWNIEVSKNERIKNCRAVFHSDWLDKARGLNLESTLKWKSVYFSFFPWKRNSLFTTYWSITGANVTIINFKYYKMPCNDMIRFLTTMPQLVDVTFNQCSFEMTKQKLPDAPKIKYLRSSCNHEGLDPSIVVPPPLIRALTFIRADHFPLCVLDLMERRCRGTLEKFHYDHARMATWKRQYYRPTKESVDAFIMEILRNNAGTIRDFSFFRNFRGDLFLTATRARNINLSPVEASIGQQASWRFMRTAPDLILFIQLLPVNALRKLTVRFIHRFSGPNLVNALEPKHNLRYLMIDSVWAEIGFPVDLSTVLPHLTQLEELVIRDRNRRRQPSIVSNYLNHLPHSLKKLTFYSYYMEEPMIITFVQSVAATRLHTLNLEGGRYVSDATFQLIINNLRQLEVLSVNDSRYLTDSGVTGLPLESVKQIIKCNQRALLIGDYQLDETQMGGRVPVSRMTNLRKLSLAGCRKLSDITIFLGIKFPYLREVDLSRCLNVTDIGIIHLSKNNPSLERIVLMKNLKVTHFGLDQCLLNNPCIENIHTSKKVRDRNMGKQIPYTVSDRFLRAVTYCHWDERRARPMNSD